MALSYAGAQAANAVTGIEGITDVLGKAGTEIAANTAKSIVASGGKIDPVDALLASGLTTGVGTIVGAGDFTPAQQKALSATIMGAVTGQTPEQIAMSAAMAAATANSPNVVKIPGSTTTTSTTTSSEADAWEDREITRLKSQGLTNAQISAYLDNVNGLTAALDNPAAAAEISASTPPEQKTSSPVEEITVKPESSTVEDFIKTLEPYKAPEKASETAKTTPAVEEKTVTEKKAEEAPTTTLDPITQALQDAGLTNAEIGIPTPPSAATENVEVTGQRPVTEQIFDPTFGGTLTPTKADPNAMVITGERPIKEQIFDPTFGGELQPTQPDPNTIVITGDKDKTQESVFDPTFGGTLDLNTGDNTPELVVTGDKTTTPDTTTQTVTKTTPPSTKVTTPVTRPTSSFGGFQMPGQSSAAPQMLIPELANVFYYGKDFGSQRQQISPTGELMLPNYHELSVSKPGAEQSPDSFSVAQPVKEGENDVSALLQQILSSGDQNMTPEELMQIIQARG
jgi:hypothetical protein